MCRRVAETCRDPTLWPELRLLHSQFLTEVRWQGFLRWLSIPAPGLQLLVLGGRQLRSLSNVDGELVGVTPNRCNALPQATI